MTRAMASDEVAAGEGALRTCSTFGAAAKAKSSKRGPSRATALARMPGGGGVDAGGAGFDVVEAEFRDVGGAGFDEGSPARGEVHLGQAGAPEAGGHSPGAGAGQGRGGVRAIEDPQRIRRPGWGQQRGRAEPDVAVDGAGEVDA